MRQTAKPLQQPDIKPGAATYKKPADIKTPAGYKQAMACIDALMNTGSAKLTRAGADELQALSARVQRYEELRYPAQPIHTIAGLIDQKMYETGLTQGAMAKRLGVSDAKLSMILSGKQKMDVQLLKTIHRELGVDANVLLEMV